MTDSGNRLVWDAELIGERSYGLGAELYPASLRFSKAGVAVRLAPPAVLPASAPATLGYHVAHIVFAGSDEEVGGVDAGRVVATMANEFADRPLAEVNPPRNSAGDDLLAVHDKVAVSVGIKRAHPRPATSLVGYRNPIPEPVLKRPWLSTQPHAASPKKSLAVTWPSVANAMRDIRSLSGMRSPVR